MCGIIGIIGQGDVVAPILHGLKRLEYRGYDSAGIATVHKGVLQRRRSTGKLVQLEKELADNPLTGTIGIGHTRWATHGAPTTQNAHPHITDRLALVHNGIIENFKPLKEELTKRGKKFTSETDSEVIAHLFTEFLESGDDPLAAAQKTFARLEGAFAIGLILNGDNDRMIAIRRGSPLVIGHGEGDIYIGSDAFSLMPFTNHITHLEDGDWAVLTREGAEIFTLDGKPVKRPRQYIDSGAALVDKGSYRHFMAKEIFEQPEVLAHTLAHYVDATQEIFELPDLPLAATALSQINIVACGTAYYAGMVARHWFEALAQVPVSVDIASEFRYRDAPTDTHALTILVSQSGETADTLGALDYCRRHNLKTLAIINAPNSTMQRKADLTLPIFAGPEIGVASTKAFTCQLLVLLIMAMKIGLLRGHIDAQKENALVQMLQTIPRLAGNVLNSAGKIALIAQDELAKAGSVIYMGRQAMYALALEGALKLKEISYIHAEGFAAGELKHGSIALIEEDLPVVVLAPPDILFEKTISNMQEVAARQGKIILISNGAGIADAGETAAASITMPDANAMLAPILYALPLQLLAYYTAIAKGTDVDQPRNLAKSVTVE